MKNKNIAYTGLMTALVFITTFIIKIPVPFTQGYIHLGDSMIFLSGFLLNPLYAAFSSGIGSALADAAGGYVHWIIPTFIIKSCMGLVASLVIGKIKTKKGIVTAAAITSLFWISFNSILNILLASNLINHSKYLINEIETVSNNTELNSLASNVKTKIYIYLIIAIILLITSVFFTGRKNGIKFDVKSFIAFTMSGMIMVLGYYIASYIIYGNYLLPVFSIPLNIVQFGGGVIIAYLLLPAIKKIKLNKD